MTAAATRSSLEAAAGIIRPGETMLPSEWAELNRWLKKGTTAAPGRWRNDYFPWIRPILDAFPANPWAAGWVWMKPTQVAGSQTAITQIGYQYDQEPGPTLFLCSTIEKAREFSIESFGHMIESTPVLRRAFLRGKGANETILRKPAHAGALTIAGSGSPNPMLSTPARYVYVDELDRLGIFPDMGSAFEIAEQRTSEWGTLQRSGIFAWAHPTTADRGVGYLYLNQSDMREWTIPCPHCARSFVPHPRQITIPDNNPLEAVHLCPLCGAEISDPERWRATKRGRFVSQLTPSERSGRRFLGFHISKLCHPRKTLLELATKRAACHSESQLQVYYNMEHGLPYTPATFVLTEELIRSKMLGGAQEPDTVPSDTQILAAGVDVQKGPDAAILYWVIGAYTSMGNLHLLRYGRSIGFQSLHALLCTYAPIQPGVGPRRLQACAIDYGWKTREVYTFCRQPHGGIPCIPVKHTPGVQPDQPTRRKETVDPMHPELGKLRRYELCRDHWMDRIIGRLSPEADPTAGGSIILPADTSSEFQAHLRSPRRVETEDRHGHTRLRWEKDKKARDDWLQGAVYLEVAAVALGLDSIQAPTAPQPISTVHSEIDMRLVRRAERSRGRRGKWIRGRRGRQ